MSFLIEILILLYLCLISCKNPNSTEKAINNTNEAKEQIPNLDDILNAPEELRNQTLEHTFSHNKNNKKIEFDKNRPFNLTQDEMDTMMFCTIIIQETLKTKKSLVENIQKKMNLSSPNSIYEKLGTDMFSNCNNKADIKIVNKFIKNLTYFNNFKWDKSFSSYIDIDIEKYNNITDLSLTMNQQLLMYKYQRVDELFRQKRADQRDKIDEDNQKIKIGELDMNRIPNSLKLTIFLVVLVLFFGGVFYLLKSMEKKPKDKKKNKKKKIQ